MINPDILYYTSERYRNLLDKINAGISEEYLEDKKGNTIEACKHGEKVWNYLQELMKMLGAKSVFDLDNENVLLYDVLFWACEFAIQLHMASMKVEAFVSKKLEFCESYLEMHSNMLSEEVRNLGNIRNVLAQTYYRIGKEKEADALYRKWLSVEPDWGFGWIGWSDCYWLYEIPKLKRNFDKAERILKEGLSVPRVSDIDFLKERFADMQKKKLFIH